MPSKPQYTQENNDIALELKRLRGVHNSMSSVERADLDRFLTQFSGYCDMREEKKAPLRHFGTASFLELIHKLVLFRKVMENEGRVIDLQSQDGKLAVKRALED